MFAHQKNNCNLIKNDEEDEKKEQDNAERHVHFQDQQPTEERRVSYSTVASHDNGYGFMGDDQGDVRLIKKIDLVRKRNLDRNKNKIENNVICNKCGRNYKDNGCIHKPNNVNVFS